MFACVSCFRSLNSALVALVQLLVELLDDALLEDALAACLALGATQHDPPVARPFLGPVERIRELAGAVKADVQRIGSVRVVGRGRRGLVAIDDVYLLAARQLHAMAGVIASLRVHDPITDSSTCAREAFSGPPLARRFA